LGKALRSIFHFSFDSYHLQSPFSLWEKGWEEGLMTANPQALSPTLSHGERELSKWQMKNVK